MLLHWHWKAAACSAIIRCTIFFAVNFTSSWEAASGAAIAEFLYRFVASGHYGAMTQGLSRMQPHAKANFLVLVALPLLQHAIEYALHLARGTPRLNASIAVSYAFTILSTLFNLYSMRRGALLVGQGARTLREDLITLPRFILGFLMTGPRLILRHGSR